ncbi:hypothetical protein BDA99DRAFT_577561 [Phascolomyces articulosus]|uniref:Uncharacterized protein n=1 Tax=Phascolomyces articulosus TaxID=60185 RepID=A0AAD5P6M1_9FUNG|nr:hypothetical protein BDA99DRAFT_577561 [Phascolomyces articulosus]
MQKPQFKNSLKAVRSTTFDFPSTQFSITQKTSISHVKLLNSKRKISAANEIEREKIGKRIDTIYLGSSFERGGLEIGTTRDNTEELQDSALKLSFVLKDMLTDIINQRLSLLRKAHVLGYNINSTGITLLDVDCYKGNVVRIWRTHELVYPMADDDYVSNILAILELAAHGKAIVDNTYKLYYTTRIRPSANDGKDLVAPSFVPSEIQQSSSSSSSTSSKKKCFIWSFKGCLSVCNVTPSIYGNVDNRQFSKKRGILKHDLLTSQFLNSLNAMIKHMWKSEHLERASCPLL